MTKFILLSFFFANLLLILLNIHAISSYFSQDDFFHLRLVFDKELKDLPSFFIPKFSDEQTFYRPLSRELYNFIMFKLYNLNPFPYHLVNLLLIFVNSCLVFVLIRNITKKVSIAFLTFLIYALSPIHSVELYYLSSVQTLLSTFFVLISLLNYHKFSKSKKIIHWYISILSFTAAVLSHESSVVLVGILFLYEIFYMKNYFRKMTINLLPFILLLLVRILIHFIFYGIPQQEVYKPVFSISSVINSFIWLSLWTLGLPEMLRDFITLKFETNPNLMRYYKDYMLPIAFAVSIIFIVIVVSIIRHFRNLNSIFYFLFFSFVMSLTPFIFFPKHIFTYYLNLPLLLFAGFIAYLLFSLLSFQRKGKFLIVLFIVSFSILSWQTIQLNKITHWSAKRAKAAEFIVEDVKQKYPNVEKGSIFYIADDPNYPFIAEEWGTSSKQAFFVLSGPDAFRLLYNDSTIQVYYQAVNYLPSDIKSDKVIHYTAKFPF